MDRRSFFHPFVRMVRRGGGAFRPVGLVAALALAVAGGAAHGQNAFPFGREMTMEIAPLTGTERLPTLEIDDQGLADLDLWCAAMKVRLIVVADTVTVLTGPKSERACTPEQASADEAILAALAQVANWRLDEDVLVLTGAPTELRFRLHTN